MWGQLTIAEGGINADFQAVGLVKWLEHLTKLSLEATKRFESKILNTGLNIDLYVIDPNDIPKVQWSDVMCFIWLLLLACMERGNQGKTIDFYNITDLPQLIIIIVLYYSMFTFTLAL